MMSSINEHSALPLNKQVENYLRPLVQEEKYRKGQLLPTEIQLAEELGVARNTVRTAMDKLVREGIITRKKGVGTQVNRAPIVTDLTRWNSFSLELGGGMHTLSRTVSHMAVNREVGADLGLLPGQQALCLQRLKGIENEPMVLLVSYFPRELNISPDEKFEGRLYQVLQEKYGVRPARSCEEIGASPPTQELSRKLSLPRDVPVLYRKRRVLDGNGNLIELAFAFYRADRFVYQIDIPWEGRP